jgi:hypothetical protein
MEKQIYYKIAQSYQDNYRIKTHLGLPPRPDGYPTSLFRGKPVIVPTPKVFELNINCREDESPRHFILGIELLVVSGLFLNALRQAGVDNFETWPAILRDPETEREWKDYFMFNEIGLLDPADLKKSKYDTIDGGDNTGDIPSVLGFHNVTFNEKKTRGAKMFRILQFPPDLYISKEVMDVLDELRPPEKWGIVTNKIETL